MSNADLQLQLLLKLNDQVSQGLKRILGEAQKDSKALAGELGAAGKAAMAIKPTGVERLSAAAREADPYVRAVAQGLEAARRAADSIKPTAIERMSAAMRGLRDAAGATWRAMQNVAQAGGALMAGGYVIRHAAAQPMAYDLRLALMANTAFPERDVAGRIAGKAELDAAVIRATRTGGGSREQAAATLDELLASNAMTQSSAVALLPALQKFSTATGADPRQLAQIAARAKQNFQLTDAEVPIALSKALKAGQLGGFELRDMARWLPQQMGLSKGFAGMKGMRDFETLLAYNQAVAITAGTKDEAGNNLRNLLSKINSQDSARDAEKLGIDLSGRLTEARLAGINPLDAFVAMIAEEAGKDKNVQSLRAKAKAATGAEQHDTYEAMAQIMMGKGIGKFVQDMQAMSALLAAIDQKGYLKQVREGVAEEKGQEGERAFAVVAASLSSSVDKATNEWQIGASTVMNSVAGAATALIEKLVTAAQAYPNLTAATVATTTAIAALGAAAGAAALVGGLKGAAGGAGASAIAAAAAAGGVALSSTGGAAMRYAGAAAMLGTAYGLPLAIAGAAGAGAGYGIYKSGIEGTAFGDLIGRTVAQVMAVLGSKEAQRTLKVEVDVKNGNIVTAVNEANSRESRRH